MNKKRRSFYLCIFIFIACMGASLFLTVKKTSGILNDNYENNQRIVSSLIANVIDNDLLRPITVAETVSKDATTREIMKEKVDPERMEDVATDYLGSIRDGFGYSMVFAVSEGSKAFYSPNGISKYVNPGVDPGDDWYKEFIEAGKKHEVTVDIDEAANWSLSVFINNAVYDDNNRFLGVCGVGVDMTELQGMLEKYERIYNVKIDLVNDDGLIQVDTDTSKIEKDYIEISDLANYKDGACYYEINKEGNRTITYMEDIEWFLVVQDVQGGSSDIYAIIRPSVVILVIGIVGLVILAVCVKAKDGYTKGKANKKDQN